MRRLLIACALMMLSPAMARAANDIPAVYAAPFPASSVRQHCSNPTWPTTTCTAAPEAGTEGWIEARSEVRTGLDGLLPGAAVAFSAGAIDIPLTIVPGVETIVVTAKATIAQALVDTNLLVPPELSGPLVGNHAGDAGVSLWVESSDMNGTGTPGGDRIDFQIRASDPSDPDEFSGDVDIWWDRYRTGGEFYPGQASVSVVARAQAESLQGGRATARILVLVHEIKVYQCSTGFRCPSLPWPP